MKARTKIEKQVAASNEKLTVLSPKVLTWAVRKVAGHICFRTSAHKCTCGECGRHFDHKGKGKSVCCPHCGTRLEIKNTLKRTLKEACYFSSLNIKYIDNQLVTVIKIQMICKCKYKTI